MIHRVNVTEEAHNEVKILLTTLAGCEETYRHHHDHFGGDDMRTGRAWDAMRRAGDNARKLMSVKSDMEKS
jgi:hypothetical protein